MEGRVVVTRGERRLRISLLFVRDSRTILFDMVFRFVSGYRVE
jgi:hypothetical protein